MLLPRQFELVVLLVLGFLWTWVSLCEGSVTACFDTMSGLGDLTPAPTITVAWHDRRELRQDPRLATCQLETQNDISSILDNYSQSQQQSSSTAHNHPSVQTRPAGKVWPIEWPGERDLCNLYCPSAQIRISLYTCLYTWCHRQKRPDWLRKCGYDQIADTQNVLLWPHYWLTSKASVRFHTFIVQTVKKAFRRADNCNGYFSKRGGVSKL